MNVLPELSVEDQINAAIKEYDAALHESLLARMAYYRAGERQQKARRRLLAVSDVLQDLKERGMAYDGRIMA